MQKLSSINKIICFITHNEKKNDFLNSYQKGCGVRATLSGIGILMTTETPSVKIIIICVNDSTCPINQNVSEVCMTAYLSPRHFTYRLRSPAYQ